MNNGCFTRHNSYEIKRGKNCCQSWKHYLLELVEMKGEEKVILFSHKLSSASLKRNSKWRKVTCRYILFLQIQHNKTTWFHFSLKLNKSSEQRKLVLYDRSFQSDCFFPFSLFRHKAGLNCKIYYWSGAELSTLSNDVRVENIHINVVLCCCSEEKCSEYKDKCFIAQQKSTVVATLKTVNG